MTLEELKREWQRERRRDAGLAFVVLCCVVVVVVGALWWLESYFWG